MGYTTVGYTVTVTIENLAREAKMFHFVAEEMTNLRLIGTETKVDKVCNPKAITPILQFTKIAADQEIQLKFQCTSEAMQTAPTGPRYVAQMPFGANSPNTLVARAVIQPNPLLGPTPVPKRNIKEAVASVAPAPDAAFAYHLPFAAGKSYAVIQGYHGELSHKDRCAIDFGMPFGTPIHAIRDGEVVVVTEKFPDHAGGSAGLDYVGSANEVQIDHADGTTAAYVHLKMNGSAVKLNQKVKAGDLIGYVGNSGSSTVPHLHLEVRDTQTGKSRPTLFKTADAPQGVMLAERGSPVSL